MAMHAAALPASELAAVRHELAPHYGAKVIDEGDRRILAIRVPRAEPDPVNDVEAAIDYLDPRDVKDITHCILVGDARIDQVYATPLRDLMAERERFDRQEVAGWRERLPGTLAHELYKSPADPRRRWRLVVRLPVGSVRDLQESHLEELAERLGSQLEGPRMNELAAVYLIAGQDDVRMEPDHFVQELVRSWKDESRRRRILEEREAKELAEAAERRAERERLLRDLNSRFKTVHAPLRRAEAAQPVDARRKAASGPFLAARDGRAFGQGLAQEAPPGRFSAALGRRNVATRQSPEARPDLASKVLDSAFLDSRRFPSDARPLVSDEQVLGSDRTRGHAPARTAATAIEDEVADHMAQQLAHADRLQDKVDGLTARAEGLRPGEAVIDAVARKLTLQGFDVLVRPTTPFPIDIAAERKKGTLRHVVFHIADRMTAATADKLVQMARELDVDHVFCVAEQADDEAKRIISSSSVTWFRPHELRTLRL